MPQDLGGVVMKLNRLGMIWLLGLTTACTADSEPTEVTLSVLTYNVAGLPAGISSSEPETNTPLISPLLNEYEIVLVQEDFVYHRDLARDAEHTYHSEEKELGEKLVNDGLNRFSQYPFGELVRFPWPSCYGDALGGTVTGAGDCLAEKGFSAALTDLGLGNDIPIVNLHMEAGDGPEDREARTEGVRFMIDYLAEQFSDRAMIVAGDFNLHGDSVEDVVNLDLLKSELNIVDACEVLECGDDRIDRVFFRSGPNLELEALQWEIPSQFVDDTGAPLSDHDPIHVRFTVKRR